MKWYDVEVSRERILGSLELIRVGGELVFVEIIILVGEKIYIVGLERRIGIWL